MFVTNLLSRGAALAGAVLLTGMMLLLSDSLLTHPLGGAHYAPPIMAKGIQMHHSAERVDIWGAFYFHPLDMLGWAFLGSLVLVLGIGLTGEAAFIVAIMATFCSMFQHSNIRTPNWLGFIVTRPESHSVHHERGVHGFNYGDIPLFDVIFGTFRNPRKWDGEAGFYEGSSAETAKLLAFRKIA